MTVQMTADFLTSTFYLIIKRLAFQLINYRQVPNKPCSAQTLKDIGIDCWKLDADKFETDDKLQAIRDVRGYSYQVILLI